jgi:hypothetical protein
MLQLSQVSSHPSTHPHIVLLGKQYKVIWIVSQVNIRSFVTTEFLYHMTIVNVCFQHEVVYLTLHVKIDRLYNLFLQSQGNATTFTSVFTPIHPPTHCSSWKEEFEVTKGVIRIRISTDNTCAMPLYSIIAGQYKVIWIVSQINTRSFELCHRSMQGHLNCVTGQYKVICQKKKYKRTNNDPQNTHT